LSEFNQELVGKVIERLDRLEARVSELESAFQQVSRKKECISSNNAKGPSGAISRLIREGFLDTPKTRKEVQDELERQGYYYSRQAIQNVLARDFMKKKSMLTRIGKRGKWKYVEMK